MALAKIQDLLSNTNRIADLRNDLNIAKFMIKELKGIIIDTQEKYYDIEITSEEEDGEQTEEAPPEED